MKRVCSPFAPITETARFPEPLKAPAVVIDITEEPVMANERIPNDPYRPSDPSRPGDPSRVSEPNSADAPYRYKSRSNLSDDDFRSAAHLDNELQMDPELAEGSASGGRIAMYALGVALVLGAVFYGLNNSSIKEASTTPTAAPAATAQNAAPTSPPGVRDGTSRSEPGVTTGAASSNPKPVNPNSMTRRSSDPKAPPAPAPSGGTE
jgi:hypothetical protein